MLGVAEGLVVVDSVVEDLVVVVEVLLVVL